MEARTGIVEPVPRPAASSGARVDPLSKTTKGEGGAIVIDGEPEMGKTALVERAGALAKDFNVLRTVGNEAQIDLPYVSLQEFFRPEINEIEQLPQPQRIRVATGTRDDV